jgi:CDP-glycerol glycerophosphotransferase
MLSIIVAVHNVQGYLRECLDSILCCPSGELEVIAVDDHSPDHSPAILDEYASRDPRLSVIHLAANLGLGLARNTGLTAATGDYVWFVDGDDRLATGAVPAVLKRLRETDPDLLLVDHTRVNWRGEHSASGGRSLLSETEPRGCVALSDERRLVTLLTVAWNKVLRAEFLHRTGLRFDVGWYEDLPFTYPALVMADRIATLGRVCYHYRKRRCSGITQTRSLRQFEVFDQWARVFAALDALGPRGEGYREDIYQRMVWHLLVVQTRDDRLPPRSRGAFFHQLSVCYRRYRPPGSPAPDGRLDRLRHRLVAADRYAAFRGLRNLRVAAGIVHRGLSHGRRAGLAVLGSAMSRAVRAYGLMLYHLLRLLPVDRGLAVYAAYWYRGVSCNPAAVYAKAAELVPGVRGVWVVDAPHAPDMPDGVSYVVDGTPAYYRAMARARWFVNNVNFPDFVRKRPGTVHVQTHHGTPVKVMGVDQAAYPVGCADIDPTTLMRRCDRWDYSVTANAHSTEVWERSYPSRFTTLECGYPRNDRLALAGDSDRQRARAVLDLPPDATVVLYAPTHREYLTGFRALVDLEELADGLGPDTVLLVRAHYFYGSAGSTGSSGGAARGQLRDVSEHPCVEELLIASDVLITDYSSVMFDYGVLDRPIVIYAPDWDAYVRTRGVTFDLLAEPPGVVTTTPADLIDAFRTGTVWDDAATKARAQFRARFCALDDGHAAERVVRRVFADAMRS